MVDHRREMRLLQRPSQVVLYLLGAAVALALPFLLSRDIEPPWGLPWSEWFTALNFALIASIAAVAFNLLLGYTGQVSVAHAAFLILGAIAGGLFGQQLGWSFWLVLPVAAVLGALVGVIVGVPALRVRGLYLFMATLAVHFAAVFAFQKYQIAQFGHSGIIYDRPEIPSWLHWLPFIDPDETGAFRISGNERWYWVILSIAALTILFTKNVVRTREGRGFIAVRDHDVAAELLGVNVTRSKLLAFALSSALVSVAGVLLSYFIGARSAESWSLEIVLDYSIMIVVGGFASIAGGVLGAFFFFLAPVLFSWVRGLSPIADISFVQEHGPAIDRLIFGVAVVLVLVLKPSGLIGLWEDAQRRVGRVWAAARR